MGTVGYWSQVIFSWNLFSINPIRPIDNEAVIGCLQLGLGKQPFELVWWVKSEPNADAIAFHL
jgi:hypothetical protein